MFNWFKRKNVAATPDPEDKVMLHGHDLSKWNYIGSNECSYVNEEGKTTSSYPIFFFVGKNNTDKRSYCVATSNDYVKNNHAYINKHVKPWAAGEYTFYGLIKGEKGEPGRFLKDWMFENYKCEWDSAEGWWGTSDKAKYNSANTKQKSERKKKETKTEPESNVVTVEFGKHD